MVGIVYDFKCICNMYIFNNFIALKLNYRPHLKTTICFEEENEHLQIENGWIDKGIRKIQKCVNTNIILV